MRSPCLEIRGLTKSYGRLPALIDVSFTIRDGEILGLIGPNGAGKTTLFECLSGVSPKDRGDVLRGGVTLSSGDRSNLLFFLPDAISPWPSQTVAWSLDFAVGFFGGVRGRLDQLIERLELAPLLGKRIGALSKGQRKRAMLAIGLLTPQPLLLADEPFEGLDLRQGREVAAVLRDHAAEGRTLFLSIHQIADAARICERYVLLSNGRVGGEGTLDELRSLAALHVGATVRDDLEEVVLALT